MRFKCNKLDSCKLCGECCRFRENINFEEKEEADIKKSIFKNTGAIYLYPFTRYTINITPEEKKILEKEAKLKGVKIRILPKKIFITDKGIMVYDYFIDEDVCPFLTKENKCSIYDKRPLICRQFPKIEYDKEDFLKFKKSHNIINFDYEKNLGFVKLKLHTD